MNRVIIPKKKHNDKNKVSFVNLFYLKQNNLKNTILISAK